MMWWWVGLASAQPLPARHALLVGSNQGGPGQERLRYAQTDAKAVRDVLADLGDVRADRALLLEEPTREQLRDAIRKLGERLDTTGPGSSAIVYYSGHSDRNGLQLGHETYPYDLLREDLLTLDARLVLTVIDGCSSGAMVRAKGGAPVAAFMDSSSAVEGRAFLTSSSADEVSQEADHIGSSYFTHAFVSGLRGAADYDGDGRVTLREVHAFASDETLARTVRTELGAQHPTYDLQLSGVGDFVVTDVTDVSTRLELSRELRGRVFLRDADGRLRAELSKQAGRAVSLGLPAGRYSIVLDDQGRLSEGRVRLDVSQPVMLQPAHLVPVTGEVTLARGRLYATVPVALTLTPYPTSEGLDARDQLHHVSLGVVAVFAARLRGVGAGGFATAYSDGANGLQLAFGFNQAGGHSRVAQVSTGLNVASHLQGLQIGSANLAKRNRGVQLGLANLSEDNDGISIALVHLSRRSQGPVLALVPLVGDGIHEVEAWTSTQLPLNVGVKLGSRNLYTQYAFGWGPARSRGVYAIGFGGRLRPSDRLDIDLDLLAGIGGFPGGTVFTPALRSTLSHALAGPVRGFLTMGIGLEVPLEAPNQISWVPPVDLGSAGLVPVIALGFRL